MINSVERPRAPLTELALFSDSATTRDPETRLAAAMRSSGGWGETIVNGSPPPRPKGKALSPGNHRPRLERLAAQILHELDGRLLGGIPDLEVRADGEQLVLRGTASSYYVKQLAQHVAMSMLAGERLINRIEVRGLH